MDNVAANHILTEEEKIFQAVADGYPDKDEVCPDPKCGMVFKNYHHFIRCDRLPCAMSTGKSVLDSIAEALDTK